MSEATTNLKVRGTGVSWQEIEGELIVLDEDHSRYLRLVGSGALLWPLLVAGTTADALSAALAAEYELDDERARTDVHAFVTGLAANDLLEPAT